MLYLKKKNFFIVQYYSNQGTDKASHRVPNAERNYQFVASDETQEGVQPKNGSSPHSKQEMEHSKNKGLYDFKSSQRSALEEVKNVDWLVQIQGIWMRRHSPSL